jgi:hypothetical protein
MECYTGDRVKDHRVRPWRVGDRDYSSSGDDPERREPVDASVVTVGHERGSGGARRLEVARVRRPRCQGSRSLWPTRARGR